MGEQKGKDSLCAVSVGIAPARKVKDRLWCKTASGSVFSGAELWHADTRQAAAGVGHCCETLIVAILYSRQWVINYYLSYCVWGRFDTGYWALMNQGLEVIMPHPPTSGSILKWFYSSGLHLPTMQSLFFYHQLKMTRLKLFFSESVWRWLISRLPAVNM